MRYIKMSLAVTEASFSIEEIFQEIDLSVFEQVSVEQTGISLWQWLPLLLRGDFETLGKMVLKQVEQIFIQAFGNPANYGRELFLFVIISSLITVFASAVTSDNVHEAIRLILYLLFFSSSCVLLKEYLRIATDYLQEMLQMVQLLFPAWMITVSVMGGILTMQASYAIGYFSLLMLEKGIVTIFPAALYVFTLIRFTGNVQKEDKLSSFGDLILKGYEGILKGVLFCVTSIQFFQNLFLPFLDSFSKNAAGKVLSGLPGIGQGVESTIQLTYSALSLIKNSLGAVFILLIVLVTLEPVIRFALFFLLFRIGIAVFQPIADPPMLKGLQTMCDCCLMITKTILMVAFLFLIMISFICSATNITHYVV